MQFSSVSEVKLNKNEERLFLILLQVLKFDLRIRRLWSVLENIHILYSSSVFIRLLPIFEYLSVFIRTCLLPYVYMYVFIHCSMLITLHLCLFYTETCRLLKKFCCCATMINFFFIKTESELNYSSHRARSSQSISESVSQKNTNFKRILLFHISLLLPEAVFCLTLHFFLSGFSSSLYCPTTIIIITHTLPWSGRH